MRFHATVYVEVILVIWNLCAGCADTKEGVVMMCNNSKRCLDDSLRCDFWFSRNCQSESYPRDNSDTSRWPPGNCFSIYIHALLYMYKVQHTDYTSIILKMTFKIKAMLSLMNIYILHWWKHTLLNYKACLN